MSNNIISAIEFFSGIGAFHNAASLKCIKVIQAFDQNEDANRVYYENYRLKPDNSNLDSIKINQLKDAQLWWMSPPCTPFSRRGNQKDDKDPRARAFLNLISLIEKMKPSILMIENVQGFCQSKVHKLLIETLIKCGYKFKELDLCSTDFRIPMRRPRYFLVASRIMDPTIPDITGFYDPRNLKEYLVETQKDDHALLVNADTLKKYENVLNIVNLKDPEANLICFTRGYFRCNKASGSLLNLGAGSIKYVHPVDITRLLGFDSEFFFPELIPLKKQWQLAGNSVDVRAINYLLSAVRL